MSELAFDDVFARLAAIVGDALRVDVSKITPDTNLIIDLNAESIDLVDIRFRMEEAFGFRVEQRAFMTGVAGTVTAEDVRTMLTMKRMTDWVMEQKRGGAA